MGGWEERCLLSRTQLFSSVRVETINTPERAESPRSPGSQFSEENIHREKVCNGSIARIHPFACGVLCAGRGSHRATTRGRGASSPATGSHLCLDRWLPTLGRRPLCLDGRPLGSPASARSALGCPSLGSQGRPLGNGGRALAVGCNSLPKQRERGAGLAPFVWSERH